MKTLNDLIISQIIESCDFENEDYNMEVRSEREIEELLNKSSQYLCEKWGDDKMFTIKIEYNPIDRSVDEYYCHILDDETIIYYKKKFFNPTIIRYR